MAKKVPKPIQCPGLLDQFKTHFNPDFSSKPMPLQVQYPPPKPKLDPKIIINQLPPDANEIRSVIKILKNNKASLDLPAEILKITLNSDNFIDRLAVLYTHIFEKEKVPAEFSLGKISSIWKGKGSAKDPTKYRGITYLYNLYADHCLDIFISRCMDENISPVSIEYEIPNLQNDQKYGLAIIWWLGYADDLCLFAWNKKDLQRQFDILHEVFDSYGLKINPTKTETLIFNWKLGKSDPGLYPKSICSLNKFPVKNSQFFKYLGTTVEYNDSSVGQLELNNRITSATCKYYELKNFFKNFHIPLSTRIQYLHALVRSRLTYNCAAWSLTQAQFNKLKSTYLGFIRGMIKGGFSRQDEVINYTRKSDNTEHQFSKLIYSNADIKKMSKT